ncbi:RCC1 domain-containing protein [Psychrobacillus sp. FSL K6-1464]|uniref:RCC1 domain-containing protein n=1 Tax=Psychrobacillus sp. FSL K6-1464 TaxID=2921545 RepID=UPI0030FAC0D6
MNEVKNKQYKARNVLSKSIMNSTLAASLLLSGFAGVVGTTGTISDLSIFEVADAASIVEDSKTIAGGTSHTLMIAPGGSVYAWGQNSAGQLGDGTTIDKTIPTKIDGLSDVVAVDSGNGFSMALTSDGSLYTWGNNGSGQLGDGTVTSRSIPVKIDGLSDVVAMEAGQTHALAITSDGNVYAWGSNGDGQVGDGTTTNNLVPTKLDGLTDIVALEAGQYHSLAITSNGTVYAWGDNYFGQMGDDTNIDKLIPSKVSRLYGFKAIESGANHSLAILSGVVYAWGMNNYGQLGDGTKINRKLSVKVNGLPTNIVDVSAGNNHSLAISSEGNVYSWGFNNFGQLGDGTWTQRLSAQKIEGISNVVKVQAGNNHSIAITSDGKVYTWGHNGGGQLGDGTKVNMATPILIMDVQLINAATDAVKKAEETISQTNLDAARMLVTALPSSTEKSNLTSRLDTVQTAINLATQIATANTSVLKAEESKLQEDVTTALTLVNALTTGTEKTSLTTRLNVVQKAIDDTKTLATQITTATTAVVKAEGSTLQADVTAARTLVTTLPNGTEKTNLTSRLDTVQTAINLANQIAIATTSVVKAEGSLLQADVEASRLLVDNLPSGTEKSSLANRLYTVQTAIDASTVSYEEAMAELDDMKAYLLTGEGTRADVLAMKDALNVILADSASLLNASHRTDVAHYVQDVLDIIGLLEVIWDKIASGELAGLDELVSQLPESELKDNTQQEAEDAKTPQNDNTLAEAVASVEKAEQSKLLADIEASRSLVNGLADSTEKTTLTERLDAVQKGIDDAKLIAEQISKATVSVKKAETSKIQADIDAARVLVDSLPSISEKSTLTERLDAITVSPEGAELLKVAQEVVNNLNDQSTKEQIATVKGLVAKLPASTIKTELTDRISSIEANQKAMSVVAQAEERQTNYNISLAEKAIQVLTDGPLKTDLAERIQQLKFTLDAESKVKSAELTKREPYITDAMDSINKLIDSLKKTELLNRIKAIQDALSTEVEALLVEETTKYVVLAEQHKREPYLSSAKELVSKLQDGPDKTALEARLKVIAGAAPVTPEAPKVDPALLKAAETQVSYAERYKRDPYLTRAQEAVDKLHTSEVKTALQERLNVLSDGASVQIETAKLKAATDAVTKAETASDLFVIEEARSLVNGLKDGDAKQALVDGLDAIEVTEAMQFAYDLKVEIDAITDAAIKKALQEAYTAVGVAKDRQTSTYMTKASKAIEALSKYDATHNELINKLSTFFIDMQKELEMQKLVVAADNAVQLSEKYKRATYFTKAQVAIDVLSEGKAKTDLQARLDAVIN